MDEKAHPLSDTHTENDTNRSTLRSEDVPKGFGHRKRADSYFVSRINDHRMIDEESKS